MSDPTRLGEIYTLLREDKIECEKDLKEAVMHFVLNFGTEKVGKTFYWSRRNPLDVMTEICAHIEQCLQTKKTHEMQDMTDAELNFHRRLYVRLYRVKRAIRNILQQEDGEA